MFIRLPKCIDTNLFFKSIFIYMTMPILQIKQILIILLVFLITFKRSAYMSLDISVVES